MIKEFGRVVAVESDCLWVETVRKSTCNSCSAQKGCGHGILNKHSAGRSHHVRALLGELPASDFGIDDQVELGIPEQLLVNGALLVYLMPLITMLAAAATISHWWPGDVTALAGAVVGLLAGFGLLKLHSLKTRDNARVQPLVLAKQTPQLGSVALPLANPS
jgi:sigma-E factor negative regulatory protein RseC